MARLESSEYLQHIRDESKRFRDVLSSCDPGAGVPSCPDWTAADLLFHLGEVQHGWGWTVAHRPAGRDAYEPPQRPSSYDEMLAAFDEWSAGLVSALESADPADEAWTWAEDHTVGFILRRQAHEALIHRLDAEQAAGQVTPLDPRLAADGVEETLDVMYGGCPPWGTFSPLPHYVRIDLTDTGDTIWVQLGRFSGTDGDGVDYDEDDLRVVADPGTEPDAVISGTAEQLDARLWRRADGAEIHLAGDLTIVDHFRAAIHHPLS